MQKQTLSNKVLKMAVATVLATAMSGMYVSSALAKSTNKTRRPTTTVAKHEHVQQRHYSTVSKDTRATPKHSTAPKNARATQQHSKTVAKDASATPTLAVAKGVNATPILITTKATSADATPTMPVVKDLSATPAATPAVAPAKSEFVQQMLSNANAVNGEILRERAHMLNLQAQYDEGKVLSDSDQTWLTDLANRYHVANPNLQNPQTWTQLTQKVDIIPPSLVLGQSIQESGWGGSSLARRAHNYFGQMCGPSGGCFAGTRWQSFTSMRAAVTAYIHNLNSNGAYQSLRALRFQARSANEMPNSMVLANGLHAYSTLPNNYISAVKTVITNFKLRQYDTTFA